MAIERHRVLRGLKGLAAAVAASLLAGVLVWPALRAPVPIASSSTLPPVACAAGTRPGTAGRHDDFRTRSGLRVAVRTPANYEPRRAYALLVAFPPAGFAGSGAERYYQLTEAATRHGSIVAYPDAIPLSRQALTLQEQVAPDIAASWCVDPGRIAYLGHSDGASVAEGLLLRRTAGSLWPRHVVASAAGLRGEDFGGERCPVATDLILVHSLNDLHFPHYGQQAARWWAACWSCRHVERLASADAQHCADLGPCAGGAGLQFCTATESHAQWPQVVHDPFPFLDARPSSDPASIPLSMRAEGDA